MKLGHNKSLALEAFVRENAPASPSGPSLPPPSSLGGGGGGAGAKNSSSAKFQLQLKPRPARSFREWQAGIALFAGGNVFNFVSFGFAAQSLLAALGSVQFVSNVVFARLVLKEAVTWRVLCATALIVTGESGERKREKGRSWRRKGKKRKKKKKLTGKVNKKIHAKNQNRLHPARHFRQPRLRAPERQAAHEGVLEPRVHYIPGADVPR